MAKVTIIQQVFNSRKWVELVYPSIVNQTYKDVEIVAQIVIDEGGCEEYIRKNFPQIIIEKPGYNIGFAKGHNELFEKYDSEFYQLVNPDLVLEPNYIEEMLKAFEANISLGQASGKLLQYDLAHHQKTNIIDTTGIVMSWNGRARDRGQHEVDAGQYDSQKAVVGVSGAGPMYRKTALSDAKFDEEFHAYWEDTDLSLRLQNLGWQAEYVPTAVAYHGRTAGSSKEGYKDVGAFVEHHKRLSGTVKQLNYKNHIFVVVKNFPKFSWKFFVREFFMLGYILVLETRTLAILPTLFKQLPHMWQKRKWIAKHRKTLEWTKLLNDSGLLS